MTDYEQIKKARHADILYTSIDYAIIGVAFAQFVLEGKISSELKTYGIKAINRQLLLTTKGDYAYSEKLKAERVLTLKKQLEVLERTK